MDIESEDNEMDIIPIYNELEKLFNDKTKDKKDTLLLLYIALIDTKNEIAYSKQTGYSNPIITQFVYTKFHSNTKGYYDYRKLNTFFKNPSENGIELLKKHARVNRNKLFNDVLINNVNINEDRREIDYLYTYTNYYPFGIPPVEYCYNVNIILRKYSLYVFSIMEKYSLSNKRVIPYFDELFKRSFLISYVEPITEDYNNYIDTINRKIIRYDEKYLIKIKLDLFIQTLDLMIVNINGFNDGIIESELLYLPPPVDVVESLLQFKLILKNIIVILNEYNQDDDVFKIWYKSNYFDLYRELTS